MARRDHGQPNLTPERINALADSAYVAHSEPIPYESPRYRAFAELDGNRLIEGRSELFPLFLAAARDYTQPLFSYGPPRLFRVGVELLF
jgi:hypothetical protein